MYAVPCILESNPRLLGYYRLLLGFSQKQFYGDRYDFGPFRRMEERGSLPPSLSSKLQDLCAALSRASEQLIAGVTALTHETVHDLTLLTLGPQLRGGALNLLGSRATKSVFELIQSLLSDQAIAEGQRSLEIINAAGRKVRIEFANDPDICIREQLPSGQYRNLVAVEIKGGRDHSNIHNRIGEAEKSHQKAKQQGYVECWTVVGVRDMDIVMARSESPTTNRFYHLAHILRSGSEEAKDFRESLLARIGLQS